MNQTVPHWLTKQATLSPNKIAITLTDGSTYTFLELKDKSVALVRKFASLGIKKGEKVAVLSGNSIDMVVTLHALSYIGAIAVLLNTRLTTTELHYQLTISNTKLLITSEKLASN